MTGLQGARNNLTLFKERNNYSHIWYCFFYRRIASTKSQIAIIFQACFSCEDESHYFCFTIRHVECHFNVIDIGSPVFFSNILF